MTDPGVGGGGGDTTFADKLAADEGLFASCRVATRCVVDAETALEELQSSDATDPACDSVQAVASWTVSELALPAAAARVSAEDAVALLAALAKHGRRQPHVARAVRRLCTFILDGPPAPTAAAAAAAAAASAGSGCCEEGVVGRLSARVPAALGVDSPAADAAACALLLRALGGGGGGWAAALRGEERARVLRCVGDAVGDASSYGPGEARVSAGAACRALWGMARLEWADAQVEARLRSFVWFGAGMGRMRPAEAGAALEAVARLRRGCDRAFVSKVSAAVLGRGSGSSSEALATAYLSCLAATAAARGTGRGEKGWEAAVVVRCVRKLSQLRTAASWSVQELGAVARALLRVDVAGAVRGDAKQHYAALLAHGSLGGTEPLADGGELSGAVAVAALCASWDLPHAYVRRAAARVDPAAVSAEDAATFAFLLCADGTDDDAASKRLQGAGAVRDAGGEDRIACVEALVRRVLDWKRTGGVLVRPHAELHLSRAVEWLTREDRRPDAMWRTAGNAAAAVAAASGAAAGGGRGGECGAPAPFHYRLLPLWQGIVPPKERLASRRWHLKRTRLTDLPKVIRASRF